MEEEKEKILFNKYKKLFPQGKKADIKVSLMSYGFECKAGWFDILDEAFSNITKMFKEAKIIDTSKFTIVQVKEKFGGLRVYYQYYQEGKDFKKHYEKYVRKNEEGHYLDLKKYIAKYRRELNVIDKKVSAIIEKAEKKSYNTCEFCGEAGKIRDSFLHVRTLCDNHFEELKKRIGEVRRRAPLT